MPLSIVEWQPPERIYNFKHGHQEPIDIPPNGLDYCPRIAALIANTVATYSRSDLNSLLVISEFVGGNRTLQFKMFSEIDSSRIKNNMISLIDPADFQPAMKDYLDALKLLRKVKIWRDRFAHGIYGIYRNTTDKIVVFDMDQVAGNIHEIADPRVENKLRGNIIDLADLERLNVYVESINVFLWDIYLGLRQQFLLPSGEPNLLLPPGR